MCRELKRMEKQVVSYTFKHCQLTLPGELKTERFRDQARQRVHPASLLSHLGGQQHAL